MSEFTPVSSSLATCSATVAQDDFRRACARYATGIAIATSSDRNGAPCGLTVNSFTSVSCSPPLVLVCIDYRCAFLMQFCTSPYFGVNVLAEEQLPLSIRFSQQQGDRFDGADWYAGVRGVPLLREALATFECAVSQIVEAGDHAILIGQVLDAACRDGKPLIYYKSAYRSLGEA